MSSSVKISKHSSSNSKSGKASNKNSSKSHRKKRSNKDAGMKKDSVHNNSSLRPEKKRSSSSSSSTSTSNKSKTDNLSHIDKNPVIETESTDVTSSAREKMSNNNNNSKAATRKNNEKYRSFENWIWAYKVFMKNNHGRHPSGVIKINNESYNIATWKTHIRSAYKQLKVKGHTNGQYHLSEHNIQQLEVSLIYLFIYLISFFSIVCTLIFLFIIQKIQFNFKFQSGWNSKNVPASLGSGSQQDQPDSEFPENTKQLAY